MNLCDNKYAPKGRFRCNEIKYKKEIDMKKTKKIFAFLLTVIMVVSVLVSCAKKDDSGETEIATVSEETVDLWEALPKNDYNGVTFNILQPVEQSYEFATDLTGSLVNDAVYKRDLTIESAYNIDLNYIPEPGNWTNRSTYLSLIRGSIQAEDGAYDLVNGMTSIIMPLTMEGLFFDYSKLDGIDFTDPWWINGIYDDLQIADKLYTITGSSMLSMYKTTYVMYANTTLINQRQMDNPIQLVLDGKWTMEQLLKMTLEQGQDLNNNGKDAEDFYGFASSAIAMRGFQTAFDLDLIGKDASGKLIYLGPNDRYFTAVDEFKKLASSDKDCFIADAKKDADPSEIISMFAADRTIFLNESIETAEKLAAKCDDYIIIPQPKYNEEQENYYVQTGTATGMFAIPKTAKTDMVVDILNAHGCLSYLNVVPAYYEEALKTKYVNVPENMDVIDIINQSMMLDITYAHNYTINKSQTLMFMQHTTGVKDAASHFAAFQSSMNGILEGVYNNYAALD